MTPSVGPECPCVHTHNMCGRGCGGYVVPLPAVGPLCKKDLRLCVVNTGLDLAVREPTSLSLSLRGLRRLGKTSPRDGG